MKMKKILAAMVAVMAVATMLLVGCGSSAPETLEGTVWEVTAAEANGVDIIGTASAAGLSGEMTCTFQDGEAVLNLMGQENTATYTYKDGTVTIEGESTTITDNTIEFNVDGVHLVMKKK
jgi:uncharacterized lipoprotein YehR (DUF1307 family)